MRRLLWFLAAVALAPGCSGTHTEYALLDAAEVAAPTSRTLVLSGIHGACDTVQPAEVIESPSEVRVRVPLRVRSGDCTAIGLSLRVEVELDQPLGERAVIDAERQESLPVVRG